MVSIGTIIGGLTLLVGGIVGYSIYKNRNTIAAGVSNTLLGVTTSATSIGTNFASFFENLVPRIDAVKIVNPFLGLPGAVIVTKPNKNTINPFSILNPFPEAGGEVYNEYQVVDYSDVEGSDESQRLQYKNQQRYEDGQRETNLYQSIFESIPNYEELRNKSQNIIATSYLRNRGGSGLQELYRRYGGSENFGDFSAGLQNRLLENTLRSIGV